MPPFILITPATRGLSLALTRHYLRATSLPVFATYRPHPPTTEDNPQEHRTPESVREHILTPLINSDAAVDPNRLHLLPLDLTSEESIASAAETLGRTLVGMDALHSSYIHTAFFLGGVLYPERQPADLVLDDVLHTFTVNVISHLLLIKHFSRFLPPAAAAAAETSATPPPQGPLYASSSARTRSSVSGTKGDPVSDSNSDALASRLAKWVHVSARVSSISDNRLGGWYSYRASKAALNQVIRTFDLHLRTKKLPAICVGVHPGTVRTDLSKDFWRSVPPEKLFAPEDAAAKLAGVIQSLRRDQRGKVWDWKGEEVQP